jgi:hypothetical protein
VVVGFDFGTADFGPRCLVLDLDLRAVSSSLTQHLDFCLFDFPSSVSTFGISSLRTSASMKVFQIDLLVFVFANSRTDGAILDRSLGISFLQTVAPTEVFRIDLLVFRFCEQSHRWRYFGSIFRYFIFVNSHTDGGISDRSFGISFL